MYTKFLTYLCGFIFVLYFLSVFAFSNLAFVFNGNISADFVYLSILTSGIICAVFLRFVFGKGLYYLGAIIPVIVLIFGLVYSVAINKNVYDISFDGQSYQGEAVVTMINGWNPIQNIQSEKANEYVALGKNERWLDAYPKASWVNSVAMHRITGDFKDTKFFNVAIIFATIFVVFSVLLNINFARDKFLDYAVRIILTLGFCLNPISLVQATTLNLDGQIYGFLLILFCTLYSLYISFDINSKLTYVYCVNIVALLITLINVKTAGLVYGLFFFGAFILYTLFTNFKEWKNLAITLFSGIVLGCCLFGYNPYITNLRTFGNALYPQFGSYSFDYTENTPSNFRDKNNLQIFFSSIFFETSEVFVDGPNEPAKFKLPFTVYESELNALRSSQLKKGAFGPMFSGIFILSLIAFMFALGRYYVDITMNNPYTNTYLSFKSISGLITVVLITSVSMISFILTKTSNTYRYIPHLWALIILWLLFSYQSKGLIARIISIVVILLILVNSIIMCNLYFGYQIEKSQEISKSFENWKNSGDSYVFDFGYHTSTRELLMENNIAFKNSNDKLHCDPFRSDLNININVKFSTVFGCAISK
jgi:hypothetical protein